MQDQANPTPEPTAPPPFAQPGRFKLRPMRDSEGNEWGTDHGTSFETIWDWGYYIDGGPPDPRQYTLAIKISDAADTVREFGRPTSVLQKANEGSAAQETMTDLFHLFSAVLVQNQQADLDRSSDQVDKLMADFFRRVVTPRHRRNLRGPVKITISAMIVALLLAWVGPWAGATVHIPASMTDLVAPICYTVAGTLMGRLLFFAISHSEKIADTNQYFQFESVSGEAATLSMIFDIIVGIAAFVLFQTGLIIISIGAEAEAGFQGVSTLQIDENGLVAFVFGMLIGISRTAFLSRLRNLAKDKMAGA